MQKILAEEWGSEKGQGKDWKGAYKSCTVEQPNTVGNGVSPFGALWRDGVVGHLGDGRAEALPAPIDHSFGAASGSAQSPALKRMVHQRKLSGKGTQVQGLGDR